MTSVLSEVPRIYTSFAEFEREERARLGLEPLPEASTLPPELVVAHAPHTLAPLPELPAIAPHALAAPFSELGVAPVLGPREERVPKRRSRSTTAHTPITATALRAEGVLEIGCAPGTSVLVRAHAPEASPAARDVAP